MPGAIATIKSHMVWDGEVINYIPLRELIKKELEDFQSEEEKVIWHHLDAWNPINEVLCGMQNDLKNLTSFPESYHIEN